ncbi:MAG TPA: choice-of-anchor R domain-containing protein [Candidatus Paceibacterota bacterium]
MASTRGFGYSKQAFLASNSAINEAIYRLKAGKVLPGSVTISLASSTATITTTAVPGGKQISVSGTDNSYQRNIQANISYASGVAFNYGLQAGNGGINMGGGSTVDGNLYANGRIDAISATITGSAVSAGSTLIAADQSNNVPSTPPNSIMFRNAQASADFAQSFTVGTSSVLNKISIYIKRVGSPGNATVYIVADNAGSPSTAEVAIGSVTLTSASVGTSYSWVDLHMSTKPALVAGSTYWLVIDSSSTSGSAYYVIGANNTYASGAAKTGIYNGTWNATSLDGYFITYYGGASGYIGGAGYVGGVSIGSGGVGDAWASTVTGASVAGSLYCTTGTHNNKSCNVTHGSAPAIGLPYTDENISDWKSDGQAGGTTNGNVHVDWRGLTLGPREITGDLTIDGGGVLTMTGTLYVHGNVTITGGGKIILPSSFDKYSATIVSDGQFAINGGGSTGSGNSKSYLFLVTTSKCPNDVNCGGNDAIEITGGAGSIAVAAQNGTVSISGGGSLKAAVGNNITIGGGSTVTYDSGLAAPEFANGPSGGYSILNWKEY